MDEQMTEMAAAVAAATRQVVAKRVADAEQQFQFLIQQLEQRVAELEVRLAEVLPS
jgi:hypothetical protein